MAFQAKGCGFDRHHPLNMGDEALGLPDGWSACWAPFREDKSPVTYEKPPASDQGDEGRCSHSLDHAAMTHLYRGRTVPKDAITPQSKGQLEMTRGLEYVDAGLLYDMETYGSEVAVILAGIGFRPESYCVVTGSWIRYYNKSEMEDIWSRFQSVTWKRETLRDIKAKVRADKSQLQDLLVDIERRISSHSSRL